MIGRRDFLVGTAALTAPMLAAPPARALRSGGAALRVDRIMSGLDEPWGLGFLPGGGFVVTERGGRLTAVSPEGTVTRIGGLPEIDVNGQGGLLDVMVPRDFARSRELFLSFARRQGSGAGTALASGRWEEGAARLAEVRVLFESAPGARGGRHFGSRIVEAPDGNLFLTIGDRGEDASAQDLSNHNGTVVRIARDGRVPADNPFVATPGARPEIWSYGHRNPQGAALDAGGALWVVEHGARGGDEVNRVDRGANHGWPVISYGRHYSGARIGEGTSRPGMVQPRYFWDPSIAPSGLMIHSGRMFPGWRGQMFTGSLNSDHIARLGGTPLAEIERIAGPETQRVRDIREAPDGSVWFLSVGQGTVYRLLPG